ncbi:carbohydrate ABC transporter permease [Vagococcus fluvialis]|uniref:carbohydrate ABC transporter permease n=2 Tax=Vagococcus fluvialis TaxID=2738 RepID=UPI0037B26F6A
MKVDNTMQTTKTVKKSKNSFSLKNHMAKHAIVYVFMIPVLIHFTIFFLAPIVFSFIITFFDWPIIGTPEFIGLGNWQRFLGDAIAWKSLKNTLVFSIYYIVPSMSIGLMLAQLIVSQKTKVGNFFKGIFFLPVVTSFVVVAGIWQWLFRGTGEGFINQFLGMLGLPEQMFLSSSNQALLVLAGLSIFKIIGSTMIYYFAGLQGIPEELYEAARIDGASKSKVFWKITFPLLLPIHFYVAVMTTIGSFQVFDSAFLLTSGGPNFATNTIVYYMYQEGFSALRLGYASVLAYVLFFMVFLVSLVQKRFLGKTIDYS